MAWSTADTKSRVEMYNLVPWKHLVYWLLPWAILFLLSMSLKMLMAICEKTNTSIPFCDALCNQKLPQNNKLVVERPVPSKDCSAVVKSAKTWAMHNLSFRNLLAVSLSSFSTTFLILWSEILKKMFHCSHKNVCSSFRTTLNAFSRCLNRFSSESVLSNSTV